MLVVIRLAIIHRIIIATKIILQIDKIHIALEDILQADDA